MLSSPWWPLSFFFAALTAAGYFYAWRLARKGMRDAREGWSLARKELERERELARLERDTAAHKLERLQRERELEHGNVRTLLPVSSSAKASDNHAGFARMAVRAWILWFNDCPIIVPFRTLLASSDIAPEARVLMCCELYARAVMESALAAHFDGTNPRSDRAVLEQIASALGDSFAERVAADVALRGVTFSSGATPAEPPALEASSSASAPPLRET